MILNVNGFSCGYRNNFDENTNPLLSNLNFEVKRAKILTIFGSNGTGKSTLLKFIAGHPIPNSFWYESTDINIPDSNLVGYVPQMPSKSIFEWLNGLENIVFPVFLEYGKWNDAYNKINQSLIIEINDLFNQYLPLKKMGRNMSGGEMQSIILTRELLFAKDLLLLDEAVSAIDHKRRQKVILGLRKLCQKLNIAIISVTHNIEEAVLFSDQVMVLKDRDFELVQIEQESDIMTHEKLTYYVQKIMKQVFVQL